MKSDITASTPNNLLFFLEGYAAKQHKSLLAAIRGQQH
jgi:hypothetical protein